MSKWKKIEHECYEYIKNTYSEIVEVKAYGQSDSTKADIQIIKKNGNDFFIEVKSGKSQCCQFVLFPNTETQKFDLSAKNKGPDSVNKDKIISYMNNDFEKYKQVDSTGIPIPIEPDILYGWVTDFYNAKNVKYFMTKGRDYIIFPIEHFADYFDISAVYRRKGSGSSEVCKSNYPRLLNGILNKKLKGALDFQFINEKLRCFFHSKESSLCKERIEDENTYLFENNEHCNNALKLTSYSHIYEVRKLSRTNNPNVICELKLKKRIQEKSDKKSFENEIR